jgi:predicted nucleic acid-binding protein
LRLVVDASVALRWFLRLRPEEQQLREAAAVGEAVQTQGAELFAPPHWMIEIVSVLARKEPDLISSAIVLLTELNPTVLSTPDVLSRGADIAKALDHHLFDTLYHAVALEVGATLVTADDRYYGKAKALGAIMPLRDFAAGSQ